MEKSAWKIGELAKQTGITVRTLHHYHHIGLLSPSKFTESGHRLYTKEDISRLQQIMSLKQLGFALEEIKAIIEKPDYDPVEVIKAQLERVKNQIQMQQELYGELELIYKMLHSKEEISADKFIKLIEVIQMNVQNYFTQDQMEKMKKIQDGISAEERNKMEKEWTNFINKLQKNFDNNTPVDHPEVAELARFWNSMIAAVTNDDPEITKRAERFHAENPNNPMQFGMTGELYNYLKAAVSKLQD